MHMDATEEAEVRAWRRKRFWRFVGTGVLAAVIGVSLFYAAMLPVGVGAIIVGRNMPSTEGARFFFSSMGVVACLVCFVVSWLVGGLRFTASARWACPTAYLAIWLVHAPLVYWIVKKQEVPAVLFLLLACVALTFLGGDLGDRRRDRRQARQMEAEAEAEDRALTDALRKRAGWAPTPTEPARDPRRRAPPSNPRKPPKPVRKPPPPPEWRQ